MDKSINNTSSIKNSIAQLYNSKAYHEGHLNTINKAINALQDYCTHDMILKDVSPHEEVYECTICRKQRFVTCR